MNFWKGVRATTLPGESTPNRGAEQESILPSRAASFRCRGDSALAAIHRAANMAAPRVQFALDGAGRSRTRFASSLQGPIVPLV